MSKKLIYGLLLMLIAGSSLPSCKLLNPSIMLRTGPDYEYTQHPDTAVLEYVLHANDQLQFQLFANDGFKLIDMQTGSNNNQNIQRNAGGISYLIEFDGMVKLPLLGRIKLEGLTIRQAEQLLESKYTDYYKNPFAVLQVTNKRVIVFPGSGGSARVVTLNNENTTLIEAIALSGGIQNNGKAHRVKLIRGNLQNPEIYLVDLSTIEGVKQADMVLQANDIIYVEPRLNLTSELLQEITPIISLITSTFLVVTAIQSIAGGN